MSYHHAALGGTFDHFHNGHKQFLTTALASATHLTVGITTDHFFQKKAFPNSIEPYDTRVFNLQAFFKKQNALSRVTILPLLDLFGPTLTDSTIDCLVVTSNTKANAIRINTVRKQKGLSPLPLVIVPLLLGTNQQVVSSHHIREGIMSRTGESYDTFFEQKDTYILPSPLRQKLQHPMGIIMTDTNGLSSLITPTTFLICVGDIVSINTRQQGYHPALSIIDKKTHRTALSEEIITSYFSPFTDRITNNPGTITKSFAPIFHNAVKTYITTHSPQVICVTGEEDLLALPSILFAPLGAVVVYGQKDVGMIVIVVTEETKTTVQKLLDEF